MVHSTATGLGSLRILSQVTPKGWLVQQLKLQAEGLSGHLSQFWPDIKDSIWIGGKADGGLHERTPSPHGPRRRHK